MRQCCAVLVNYLGAAETAAAALAVLIDAPGIRVLVVDNSHDAAEHALLQALLPRTVEVLDAGSNLGFGRACNLAWLASQEEFVLFVNPDVRLQPGCTAALVDAMGADPTLAAVAPRQYLDSACRWHLPPAWLPTPIRAWSHEKALRDSRAWHRLAMAARAEGLRLWLAKDAPVVQRALSGGALMLRRAALPQGEEPFDPRFFMYYEDSDLCMRLRRRHLRLAVQPQAGAVHAWRNLPHKTQLMNDAAAVYFAKYDPSGTSTWNARARALAALPVRTAAWPAFAPWPTHGVHLPTSWHGGWALELGLSPLLQTVLARIGAGPVVEEPLDALAQLGGAAVYGRLGPLHSSGDEALYFHWPAGSNAPVC